MGKIGISSLKIKPRKDQPKRISLKTKVIVEERGKRVKKPLGKVLPPKKWFKKAIRATAKGVKRDLQGRSVRSIKRKRSIATAIVAANWWKRMSPESRIEVLRMDRKLKGFGR